MREDEQVTASSTNDAKAKMLSGSAWMTAGSITSRILGAIYIIPWTTWLGAYSTQANALYAQGYNIYSVALTIATAGIPSAISKLVAHYNGIDEYEVSRRLYRSGMYVSMAMGIVCATVMLFGANLLNNGDANVTPVIQSLAWAVLVIPPMSITRGFLQGYNWMAPSALSQFIEQLFRVVYMLAATYFIMKLQPTHWVQAVTQSTFAAFIGALGAILVLGAAYLRRLGYMRRLAAAGKQDQSVQTRKLIFKIIYQSIPFIVIEAGIAIFQLIDQYSFKRILTLMGGFSNYEINTIYALFAFNANKLYMIVISLASAMAATAIPLMAMARAQNDQQSMRDQIENGLLLFYFVMIPASLGMAAVAQQVYTVFYRYDAAGVTILEFASFMAIPLGLYTVGAAMMQGLSENKKMMKFLAIGIGLKLILQVPLVMFLKGMGPLLATGIAMSVINYLILHSFNMEFTLRFNRMAKPTNQILAYSLIMFAAVKLVMLGMNLIVDPHGRYMAFFALLPGMAIGIAVFGYLALRYRLVDEIMGPGRAAGFRRKLRITPA
ncbi:putative polysaccharide biosynthesis protein [Limosilactobacillus ingluviei]|uniref:Polysaccharide biosynthesis protein n=1 Tax=Limosilactobacillus ingluviei DSM 15946 TaxID=1423760 RepID=A0A0R1UNB0_9LACO|nr:oligosaccharide flippase family protein [Limosilactobacillus ingluviei]KRL92453.1 polysaccharide biosynthesis protein [Limosilactobacillus ingluviei DSM 15946]